MTDAAVEQVKIEKNLTLCNGDFLPIGFSTRSGVAGSSCCNAGCQREYSHRAMMFIMIGISGGFLFTGLALSLSTGSEMAI